MDFVGNLLLFPAGKKFENPLRTDKVIAMSLGHRVEQSHTVRQKSKECWKIAIAGFFSERDGRRPSSPRVFMIKKGTWIYIAPYMTSISSSRRSTDMDHTV